MGYWWDVLGGVRCLRCDSLAPSIEDPGTNPAAFSCFVLIHDDLRQPIPAPGIMAIGTAVANSNRYAVPQQSLWRAQAFSCECMFQGERGGGLTINRQPVGPSVDTAIMTTVLSTIRVDSRRFSSRGCAFRCTCYRGESWFFTVERAYNINKAEESCQTMMKRAMMMIV